MADAQEAPDQLQLLFAGQLVEQLGAQLYPSVTASVAELISNAWDADATRVWVTIPFEANWRTDAVIEVLDNGNGMTRDQAQHNYLVVGSNRRERGETSENGRTLHGRKGIGKLAAFGTAGYLECVTKRAETVTAFGIDYDKLRKQPPTTAYETEPVSQAGPLVDPDTGDELDHGTLIRLSKLKAKRRTGEAVFRRSMARRFALDAAKMSVKVNGDALLRFEYSVKHRFPRDGTPPGVDITIGDDGWAEERLDPAEILALRERKRRMKAIEDQKSEEEIEAIVAAGRESDGEVGHLRWWIGFSDRPIPEEDVRGVSILIRGKLAQAPFAFEMSQGTTNQLGLEYLVGEVQADWLDYGKDSDDDLIQSNRDQLQLDNEELAPLLTWGQARLRWALAEWGRQRREGRAGVGALGQPVEDVLKNAPSRARGRLRTLAARIADVTNAESPAVARAVQAVVDASDAGAVLEAAHGLEVEGDPDAAETWALLASATAATRDATVALLKTRADSLAAFVNALDEPPVTTLHERIASDPWIVSPLLDGVPRREARPADDVRVVHFDEVPPVLAAITIVVWAVDATPRSFDAQEAGRTLWTVSGEGGAGPTDWSWKDVLAESETSHRKMLGIYEGS